MSPYHGTNVVSMQWSKAPKKSMWLYLISLLAPSHELGSVFKTCCFQSLPHLLASYFKVVALMVKLRLEFLYAFLCLLQFALCGNCSRKLLPECLQLAQQSCHIMIQRVRSWICLFLPFFSDWASLFLERDRNVPSGRSNLVELFNFSAHAFSWRPSYTW